MWGLDCRVSVRMVHIRPEWCLLCSRQNSAYSQPFVQQEVVRVWGGCAELAEELHPEILQRAVELAKIFYTGDNQQIMTAGTRSE